MTTGSVLFVHGSGNRREQAEYFGARIAANLHVAADHMHISTWGDSVGPDPAFPRLARTMPPDGRPAAETNGAILSDPYGPLREMAQADQAGEPERDGTNDARAVLGLLRFGGLDLTDARLPEEQLAAAAAEVAESPEFATAGGDPIALIDAAVTAAAARAVQRQGPAAAGVVWTDIDPIGKVKEALSIAVMGGVGIATD